jgi:5-methylcytosine-specific restriction endonuclease McrA
MDVINMTTAKKQGLKRYFTGNPCALGHVVERLVSNSECVECNRIKVKKWQKNNLQRNVAKSLKSRNKDQASIARFKATHALWKLFNKNKVNAATRRRQAAQLQRTPPWLAKSHHLAIAAIYQESIDLSQLLGEWHEVDHIVPLQGKTVSGLHVPWNLQVLTARENRIKNNRWSA